MSQDNENREGAGGGPEEAAAVRVMIVDDAPSARRNLRRALEKGGYDIVCEAEDGDEAVEMAARFTPDIITMDVVMKRLDGIAAAQEIKKKLPDTKIIMVTQRIMPSVLLQSIRAGADNFVHKPVDEGEIIAAMKKAISG